MLVSFLTITEQKPNVKSGVIIDFCPQLPYDRESSFEIIYKQYFREGDVEKPTLLFIDANSEQSIKIGLELQNLSKDYPQLERIVRFNASLEFRKIENLLERALIVPLVLIEHNQDINELEKILKLLSKHQRIKIEHVVVVTDKSDILKLAPVRDLAISFNNEKHVYSNHHKKNYKFIIIVDYDNLINEVCATLNMIFALSHS